MILFKPFLVDSNNGIHKGIKLVAPFLQLWFFGHQGNAVMYAFANIAYLIK